MLNYQEKKGNETASAKIPPKKSGFGNNKSDVRMSNMVILKTCNAVLHDELLRFLLAVDNVMSWAIGGFLDNITKQLGEFAKTTKTAKFSG